MEEFEILEALSSLQQEAQTHPQTKAFFGIFSWAETEETSKTYFASATTDAQHAQQATMHLALQKILHRALTEEDLLDNEIVVLATLQELLEEEELLKEHSREVH